MTLPSGYIDYFKEWEEKIGAFIEFAPEKGQSAPKIGVSRTSTPKTDSPLCGLPFAVKDNIAVKGFSLSCGSKLLSGLTAPYTATAVQKLKNAGAVAVGKTNMDEFGMGSSTDNSGIKRTNNPWDASRVAGGSSGGSAAAVAAGLVPFALGSDTGGSVRQPASFCGVIGLKPTWGAVSRYGLVAYASSLDTVGIAADSVKRCRAVFDCIKGADPLDQTSRTGGESAPPNKTIGVLSPSAIAQAIAEDFSGAAANAAVLEPEVEKAFEVAKENLRNLGYNLIEVEVSALKYGVPAYYTIAAAEASANLARFDGIRYGKRPDWAENPDELVDKSRDAGFGDEVKLRILLGTFVLRSGFQDRYYLRAQRIRAGIRRGFEAYLGASGESGGATKCDAILMPVFPSRAFGRGSESALSSFAQKAADLYTCCANLAGLPSLAFPVSLEGGLPTGVQLLGRAFAEETLFSIAEKYEVAHPFPHPPGFKTFWEQT
ncbi:MAG: aspartyl/glutamyl-tRNA amidotransferase subunit A [Spirochaetaceae bacterium]|jgi:aspartyl-tRNA(Asn)/glutamyl-tRNA(Gln) amidotransferase subunit A|nr:aspartyl/glutamyl-tRNA amidotransferase subunit A [Spirochaetaceae bacterium]